MPRSSASRSSQPVPSVGRPRRFDDETERRLLIDAAIRVIERNDYADMSLDGVLAEAGLSTRAFYRHFNSKEALLESFTIQEAQSVARSLSRVVANAPDPLAAVHAWIERFLDVFYEPRRARRAALLSSAAARLSGPSAAAMTQMRAIVCQPLIEALRAGHEAGVLTSPRPEIDAYTIHNLATPHHDENDNILDRSATMAHIMRFAGPAIGLTP
jgi:AcrR family transcriptional regulator